MVAFKANFVSTEIPPQSVISIPWSLLCPPTLPSSPFFFLVTSVLSLLLPWQLCFTVLCLLSHFMT